MNRVIQKTSLIDELSENLKRRILSGEFSVGKPLPSQDDLARSFAVSRATLREALKSLALMGLIEMRQGVGTFVTASGPDSFMRSVSSMIILDRSSIAELIEAKNLIEPPVAAIAAQNADSSDIESLGMSVENMEKEFERNGFIENYKKKDTSFHNLIAASSKNRVLFRMVESIRGLFPEALHRVYAASTQLVAESLKYHREIYEAVAKHDSQEAESSAREHLKAVEHLTKKYFSEISNVQE